MKKIFLCLFIIFFNPVILQAELIKEIKILGARKTKPWALLRRINIKVGDNLNDEQLLDLKKRLSQNSQFNINSVNFSSGILEIDLEEKWSIVPVPLMFQSGDYYLRGVGFYETNFLGRLETLVPALAYTNSGVNYLLLYNSENYFNENMGVSALVVRLNTLSRFYRNAVEHSRFESRTNAVEITPNLFFNNMVFKAGPIVFKKDVFQNFSNNSTRFEGFGLRSRFNIKNFEVQDVLFKGYYLTANAYWLKPNENRSTFLRTNIEFTGSYPVLLADSIYFTQNIGIASAKTFFYQFSEGGTVGFRGYDGESIHMQRFSSSTLQYQRHLWDRLYAIAFIENLSSVLINPIYNGRHLTEQTIGAGLQYFLRKISIPGINLEYGYNIQDKSSHLHFNVGLKL